MKWSLLFFACFITNQLLAQEGRDSLKAPYLQFPFIPTFTIYKAPDSTAFTRDDLPKKKPVILMIFSPECDHCKHQIEDMLKHMDQLKKYEIVMTTWLPYDEMVKFYDEMKIAKYKNIVMARDTKFFFPVHYGLKALPGIYVYDKQRHLVKSFESTVKLEKLLN